MSSIDDLSMPHEPRLSQLSDGDVLQALRDFEALPDESDARWHEPPFELFDRAGLFVALADQVAQRHLSDGIGLLLDGACFGDPGEMMRGLRHALEQACRGDWGTLTVICIDKSASTRPGTRLWATSELAILRDPTAISAIRERLMDIEAEVRMEAVRATTMLNQSYPDEARKLLPTLRHLNEDEAAAAVADLERSDSHHLDAPPSTSKAATALPPGPQPKDYDHSELANSPQPSAVTCRSSSHP